MKVIGIIPARYKSSRFEGKALANILGKPMVQRVYERAVQAETLDDVIVATDDERIFDCVKKFNGKVVMTSVDCPTGTDRVAEVAADEHRIFSLQDSDIIANVQGDEPLLEPAMLDSMIRPFFADPSLQVSTLAQLISSEQDYRNPNVVKVVTDKNGFAMYFSRAPIPGTKARKWHEGIKSYRHIGLYAYKRDCLLKFIKMSPARFEQIEGLEQLRFLENGIPIKVVETQYSTIGVDTPLDLQRVIEVLKKGG
ncbi:TPA: 3-deoxy-manno-octulosonate cytidylyltransferase [Candidatus Poribacteria bacterium]|nr:3-deoxy-manno-octulosonate cytidylyltransferase [Candidatus Poribacteria bacterium]